MNSDILTMIETEETLAVSEEAERRYAEAGEEYRKQAVSLLANVRHLMTGREIEACENAADGNSFNASIIDRLANEFPRESTMIKQLL